MTNGRRPLAPACNTLQRRYRMPDSNGSSGLLGVIIGVVLVLGLAYFFLGERIGLRSPPDVNVKVDTPSTTPNPK